LQRLEGKNSDLNRLAEMAGLSYHEVELLSKFIAFLHKESPPSDSAAPGVPLSIFLHSELSCFEALVCYLRDDLGHSYKEIGRLLHRQSGPIGVTYRNALKKKTGKLDVSSLKQIPLEIFDQEHYTIFECIVIYLKDKARFSFSEIAKYLCRNYRTIWTVYQRAKKKEEVVK